MAVNFTIMNEVKCCSYLYNDTINDFLEEGEKEVFWKWFENSACQFNISLHPDLSLVGKTNLCGRCFGNAQVLAIKAELEYGEGFMYYKNEYVHHGFNLRNDLIEDYTVLSNNEFDLNSSFLYYGVKIPKQFIEAQSGKSIKDNRVNIDSLLVKWFQRNC